MPRELEITVWARFGVRTMNFGAQNVVLGAMVICEGITSVSTLMTRKPAKTLPAVTS